MFGVYVECVKKVGLMENQRLTLDESDLEAFEFGSLEMTTLARDMTMHAVESLR